MPWMKQSEPNFLAENPPHSGLYYAYKAGTIRNDNTVTEVVAGTILLTDAATNYVEVDPTTGTVSKNTTAFTSGKLPMATAVTSGGAITTVTDKRTWLANSPAGGGGGSGESLIASLTNKTGATANTEGYVYRFDPDNDNAFDTASEDEDVQAVVAPNGVNIANNAAGNMVLGGWEDVYVDATGANENGDNLYFGATAGRVKTSKERKDGCIGRLTQDRASRGAGAGLVQAYVYQKETIRKWALADEPTWKRIVYVPYAGIYDSTKAGCWQKYASNPILDIGTGSDWDNGNLQGPCVIKYENLYYLFYSGQNSTSTRYQIGVATATNIFGPWTKYGSNPIIINSATSSHADSKHAIHCYVICDDYEIDTNKRFKMWYSGSDLATSTWKVCYATASNPIGPWTKYNTTGLSVTNFQYAPATVRVGRLYYMAFGDSSNEIMLATSNDAVNWINYGTIIAKGAVNDWDDNYVRYNSVYWNLGVFYVPYSGNDGTDTAIGMATSSNGFSYTKFQIDNSAPLLNQILTKGAASDWDDSNVAQPSFLQENSSFYLFYKGANVSSGKQRIGVATI